LELHALDINEIDTDELHRDIELTDTIDDDYGKDVFIYKIKLLK
jgi:hypothetical protein